MLKVLQNSVNHKKEGMTIVQWREKYKSISLDGWSFDELDNWVDAMKESDTKKELLEALTIFKRDKSS
jgi:hypothetical protein